MIINQLNSSSVLSESTVTSKDILYNKIAYGPDGKIVGNAPIDIDSLITGEMTTFGYQVTSACYGDNKYVAVRTGDKSYYFSEDGLIWESKNITEVAYWSSVCYGNDKFVAIGGHSNVAACSSDGITWTQTALPTSAYWSSVCYGNGKYVAVAGTTTSSSNKSNAVAYSTDGVTWTQTTLPYTGYWSSVCYGNGKFVAVAGNSNVAACSSDGITWTQTTLPTSSSWKSVCYGNGKFVAVVNSSDISAYSTDGVTWTQTTLPVLDGWYSVCYGKDKFVAVSTESYKGTIAFAYSSDGVNWISTYPPCANSWQTVFYGKDKFVAIPYNQGNIYNTNSGLAAYSYDGIFWTRNIYTDYYKFREESRLKLTNNQDFSGLLKSISSLNKTSEWSNVNLASTSTNDFAVCYGDNKFVAVQYNSNVSAYSTDGVTWHYSTLPLSAYWSSVCYGNGKYVAIIGSRYIHYNNMAPTTDSIAYSEDGINWTLSKLPVSERWGSICYGNGKFVITKGYGSSTTDPAIAYSEDCITWTLVPISLNVYDKYICYGNGKYIIATSNQAKAIYSTDCINWIEVTLPLSGTWYSLSYENDKFFMTTLGTGGYIAYSEDGINWTGKTLFDGTTTYWINRICYGDKKYIAIIDWRLSGDNTSYPRTVYSDDGVNWVYTDALNNSVPLSTWNMCFGCHRFIAIKGLTVYKLISNTYEIEMLN